MNDAPKFMINIQNYNRESLSNTRKMLNLSGDLLKSIEDTTGHSQDATIPPLKFEFDSVYHKNEYIVDVVIPTGKRISGFYVMDSEKIFMPQWMKKKWSIQDFKWEDVRQEISEAFQREVLKKTSQGYRSTFAITFKTLTVNVCKFDVYIGNSPRAIKGFTLKHSPDGNIKIFLPRYIDFWDEKYYTWREFKEKAISAYKSKDSSTLLNEEKITMEDKKDNTLQSSSKVNYKLEQKETNDLGRIKNADANPFCFVSRSVLRLCSIAKPQGNDDVYDSRDEKKHITQLVNALAKGSLAGGIGVFEINILEWIAQLRYATTTMIMDLIKGGYISSDWRQTIKQDKLKEIINRLEKYDLVSLTFIYSIDNNGNIDAESHSAMRIITLGKAGGIILNELGKKNSRYNPFDIYQDGGTVKKHLSTNQWLIYWLKNFSNIVKDNYEISTVVYRRGVEYSGAKFFSMVNCNNHILVGESIRRVDAFEKNALFNDIREKLNRFIDIFNNIDDLYVGREKFIIPERPILIYICEDDLHVEEIYQVIHDIVTKHHDQEIWFTTDLRMFNYDMVNARFINKISSQKKFVDIKKRLGVSETIISNVENQD